MKKFLYICIALALSVSVSAVEINHCIECTNELNDSVTISKIGYGHSRNRSEAVAMAKTEARSALLDVLRDSVAQICYLVEVQHDEDGEFLNIKYFNKKEDPTKYYFQGDSILTNVTVRCEECAREGKQEYKACCVLSAPREDFSRAS